MLKYLLLGRIGSGRNHFQKMLEKKGLKIAKSHTTREKRDDNDTSHYFTTDEPENERLFVTEHNGFIYYYTADEIESAEIIPIDPQNVKAICEAYPDKSFRFIEIMSSNEERIKHYVADKEDKLSAEADFISFCEEENEAFCEFEDATVNSTLGIDNLLMGHIINNGFTEQSDMLTNNWDEKLKGAFTAYKNLSSILDTIGEKDIIHHNIENDTFDIHVMNKDTEEETVEHYSRARTIEQILLDEQGMYLVMSAWLSIEKE